MMIYCFFLPELRLWQNKISADRSCSLTFSLLSTQNLTHADIETAAEELPSDKHSISDI